MDSNEDSEFIRKSFPAMAEYFSPAITALQKYLGLGSKELLYQLGLIFGRKMSERLSSKEPKEMLVQLSLIWDKLGIGELKVEKVDPLTLFISGCRVCGQLPGTGGLYHCAFHEGFFEALLSERLGTRLELAQEVNFEGVAGTWCRRFVTNVKV